MTIAEMPRVQAESAARTYRTPPAVQFPRNPLVAWRQIRLMQTDFVGSVRGSIEQYGDCFALTYMGRTNLLTTHPDLLHEMLVDKAEVFGKNHAYTDPVRGMARFIGEGLLTSNGDFWKRQRRLIAPKLHAKKIASYAGMMVEETERMLAGWQEVAALGATLDVDHEMMTATLHIVTRTLFHINIGADAAKVAEAMTAFQKTSGENYSIEAVIPRSVPTPSRVREKRTKAELDAIVFRLIREWREKGEDDGSLLSMLLLAETDDGERMTDVQARDEIVTMFLAGHETTANTLNWTWYLLSQNPVAEAKLHEELDRVLAGRIPTLDDLKQLPYTEQVIKEAMRLYPPAFGFARVANEDTTLGEFLVPRGTSVQTFQWVTHTDPRWWDEPMAFRPERFAPENADKLRRYAYLPFGSGPRICIGNTFAMMEAQILLAMVASRYRLRLAPGQRVEPALMLTLRPKYGLRMVAERR